MEFSALVCDKLESYVYVLVDPTSGRPFYIGKGQGNRVFAHVAGALEDPKPSHKYEQIRAIQAAEKAVGHVIIQHGLKSEEALKVEAALIDFAGRFDLAMTNIAFGHGSAGFGAMTADEVVRKYTSEPLDQIPSGGVLININKTYRRAKGEKTIYEATKESWPISESRTKDLRLVLSEYRGFVVEVFEVERWYPVPSTTRSGRPRTRWGFDGMVAPADTRQRYINRTVAKKPGSASPIRYRT